MSFGRDFRNACRQLLAAPIFAIFSIVTLSLGIGATAAVYSLIRAVTGPPPGVSDVNRLVEVYHYPTGSVPITNLSWDDYQDLRARQSAFEALTGWSWFLAAIVANGQSMSGTGEVVDGDYFRTLGVRARIGRLLQPDDDRPEAVPVAVISSTFWQRVFAGAPDVVGKLIKINGVTFHVLGVAAPEFTGLFNGGLIATGVWVPMSTAQWMSPQLKENLTSHSRDSRWVFVRGRLRAGRSLAHAQAQVAAVGKQLDLEFPIGRDPDTRIRAPYNTARHWGARAMSGRLMGVPEQMLRLLVGALMGSVTLVWLIACTNLANLMLARNSRRRAETAVRRALGASRGRLVYEAMLEPLVLVAAGGLAGLGVARVLMRGLSTELSIGNGASLQALPRLDPAVLAVGLAVTLLALVVAGVMPAFQSTRVDLRSTLATDSAGSVPRWRGRRYLIGAQVAVSVMLVAIATLYAGELRRQSRIDTGIDLEHLALVQIDFGTQHYDEIRVRQIADAAAAHMARRPGVMHVALSSGLPAGLRATPGASLRSVEGSFATSVAFVAATFEVFETLGVAITRGRPFDRRDTSTAPPVAVVSERAAQQLFGSDNPVGREVIFERRRMVGEPQQVPKTMTVVGVAADTDARYVGRRDSGVAYLPLDQHYESNLVLAVRVDGDPARLVGELRAAIVSVDPTLAISQIGTASSLAGPDSTFPRVVASLASALGGVSLVLALAGLYGVLSHVVAGRTREIGVRLALGASVAAIRRMVLREGIGPVLLGLAAGIGFGFLARVAVQPLFLGLVPAADLRLMTFVPVLFIVAGLAACYLPAHRASRVDPNVALRNL